MKNIVKKSVIFISLMSIFTYVMIPEEVNNYETKMDIYVKNQNQNLK